MSAVTITAKEVYTEVLAVKDLLHALREGEITDIKIAQAKTNGKVKFHTKLLWALGGAMLTITMFIINLSFHP